MLNKNKISNIISILLILCFFFFFYIICKTLWLGYNKTDDHEVYYFSSLFNNKESFTQLLINHILYDDQRFRPVYWIHRLVLIWFFRVNFILYYLEFAMLGISTFLISFFTMKKLGLNCLESIIIIFLIFTGSQNSIYNMLGTSELLCCFLLSIAIYFEVILYKSPHTPPRKKLLYNLGSLIFLTLTILTRENFLITVPVFVLLKVTYSIINCGFKTAIKNNLIYILISFSIFTATSLFLYINSSESPYNPSFSIKQILLNFNTLMNNPWFSTYIIFMSILLIILAIYAVYMIILKIKSSQNFNDEFKYLITNYIFILLFITSQILFICTIDQSSCIIVPRYMIPLIYALGWLLILFFNQFRQKKLLYFAMIVLCIITITINNFYNFNYKFYKEYVQININFNKALTEIKNNLKDNENILLIGPAIINMEFFESLTRYFNYYEINNIYVMPELEVEESQLNNFEKNIYNFLKKRFDGYRMKDMKNNAKVIIVFGNDELKEKYINHYKLNEKYNTKENYMDFDIYTK